MDATALYKISYGLYVIGTKLNGKDAGCIVDAFIQSTSAPVPTVILCSIQANQTNEAIKQTGEFTISVLGRHVDPFVIANFGFQSGRASNKWANVAHTRIDDFPVLKQSIAYIRCKVTDAKELPTHTVFFCEVIDAWNNEADEQDTPLTYGEYQASIKKKAQQAFSVFQSGDDTQTQAPKWICNVCGYVYEGDIPFEELPDSWTCPLCGAPKSAFTRQ